MDLVHDHVCAPRDQPGLRGAEVYAFSLTIPAAEQEAPGQTGGTVAGQQNLGVFGGKRVTLPLHHLGPP